MPKLYEIFVDTMLNGRDSITVSDIKDALQSKELNRKVSGSDDKKICPRRRKENENKESCSKASSAVVQSSVVVSADTCDEAMTRKLNFLWALCFGQATEIQLFF